MDSRGCLRLKYLICILSSPSGALMKFRRKGFLFFEWASHRRRKEKENEAVRGRNTIWQTAFLLTVPHFDVAVVVEPKK